jgi:hypothetical protein
VTNVQNNFIRRFSECHFAKARFYWEIRNDFLDRPFFRRQAGFQPGGGSPARSKARAGGFGPAQTALPAWQLGLTKFPGDPTPASALDEGTEVGTFHLDLGKALPGGLCSIGSQGWRLNGSNAGQAVFLGGGPRNGQERRIYVTKH